MRQLQSWDRLGLYAPEYATEDRSENYSRVYSFRDIVGLRTLAQLRHYVSLPELRKVGARLHQEYVEPWSSLRFYVRNRRVFILEPQSGQPMAVPSGQLAFPFIDLQTVIAETLRDIQRERDKRKERAGTISRHRYVMSNQPLVAGTRIPVAAIQDFAQAGYDLAAIQREYPQLEQEDILAALAQAETILTTG